MRLRDIHSKVEQTTLLQAVFTARLTGLGIMDLSLANHAGNGNENVVKQKLYLAE